MSEAHAEITRLRAKLVTVAGNTLRQFADVIDSSPAAIPGKPVALTPSVYSRLARDNADAADRKAAALLAEHSARHTGGNAEDCPACTDHVYPFLCPGEADRG